MLYLLLIYQLLIHFYYDHFSYFSLLINTLLCKLLDLLDVVPFPDKLLILLDELFGRFSIIFGGWLERILVYNELSFGLL